MAATQQVLDQTATVAGPVIAMPTPSPSFTPFQSAPVPGPTLPGGDCVHEVVAGDTLYRLSVRYGVPIIQIAASSNIFDVDRLSIGQKLTIPGCGTTGVTPPPTTVPTLAAATPVPGAVSTPIPQQPSGSCGGQYRVQQGQTLFEISQICGVPIEDIARANGITDYDQIDFNQVLIIP